MQSCRTVPWSCEISCSVHQTDRPQVGGTAANHLQFIAVEFMAGLTFPWRAVVIVIGQPVHPRRGERGGERLGGGGSVATPPLAVQEADVACTTESEFRMKPGLPQSVGAWAQT